MEFMSFVPNQNVSQFIVLSYDGIRIWTYPHLRMNVHSILLKNVETLVRVTEKWVAGLEVQKHKNNTKVDF